VLFAPFSSIVKLLETYALFGWLPLAVPLKSIPFGFGDFFYLRGDAVVNTSPDLVRYYMRDKWDTESAIRVRRGLFPGV
jgi:hypothetical protein